MAMSVYQELHRWEDAIAVATARVSTNIPYSQKYWRGVVDWQISCHTTNIKSANIAPTA